MLPHLGTWGNLNLNGVFTVWNLPKIVGAKEHTACNTPHSQSVLGAVPLCCCVCAVHVFLSRVDFPTRHRKAWSPFVGSLRVGGKLSWHIQAARLTDA